jgi:hypothetical protein
VQHVHCNGIRESRDTEMIENHVIPVHCVSNQRIWDTDAKTASWCWCSVTHERNRRILSWKHLYLEKGRFRLR